MARLHKPISLDTVDRIFEHLSNYYGRRFMSLWDGMELEEVKKAWAKELGWLIGRPEALAWAMEHLPSERAPDLPSFDALCRSAPRVERVLAVGCDIPPVPPKLTAERAAELAAMLRSVGRPSVSPALSVERVIGTGRPMTQFQREFVREVAARLPQPPAAEAQP